MKESVEALVDPLAALYAEKIRTLRTRSCSLEIPERENETVILHTLLGIELKVGVMRFACPDLATARYMRVFARLGCRDFAIPYDITKISTLADELETEWQRSMLVLETGAEGLTNRQRTRRRVLLVRSIREQIATIGPWEKMPEFKQSTKQRAS